ncbi:hypothetical protein N9E34_03680 [Opitutales bacterium]|nr:hypothetical protein [Opitutales bacterium]
MSIVAAAVAGGVMAAGSSYSASRNARKAQNSQNANNARLADEANYAREKEWALSNGMSLEDFENGTFDGARSAIQPFYNHELEGGIAQNISDGYESLQAAYNPEEMTQRMDGYRSSLADSELGAVGAIQGIYDGSQLSESQRYLQGITDQRLQGQGQIDLARQGIADARAGVGDARGLVGDAREQVIGERSGLADIRNAGVNAQAQAMTSEAQRRASQLGSMARTGGVVNNSGLAGSQSLGALMGAYAGLANTRNRADLLNQQDQITNQQDRLTTAQEGVLTAKDGITTAGEGLQGVRERARINELDETSKYAAYEQNLAEQKNAGQITNTLNSLANNQTAGVNNYFLPENVTTAALSGGGYLKGQAARASQYNSPSYTAPVKKGFLEHANAGVQGGLSTYMLASALSGPGTTTVPGTGSGVSYNHVPANPNTFSGGSMVA